ADRYLLRFETSNRELFERIHPPRPGRVSDRLALLGTLRGLGYEVGSGVMIGIPGQSYNDLAGDLELFRELNLNMIGVGPFLMHPATPLADPQQQPLAPPGEQVPASELMTYKVIALARLLCPRTNIPSTTALATLNRRNGRHLPPLHGCSRREHRPHSGQWAGRFAELCRPLECRGDFSRPIDAEGDLSHPDKTDRLACPLRRKP